MMIESLYHHIGDSNEDAINPGYSKESMYPSGGLQAIRESRETLTTQKATAETKLIEGLLPSPRQLEFRQTEFTSSTVLNKHLEDTLKVMASSLVEYDESLPANYKEIVFSPIVWYRSYNR